ncbi:hypothetical protein [Kitasatospora mediocidica]|uniref:hypothetical protein n=1 Tax=Kitasatospora mediocidica TaxID=58352 RepID=UPI0012FA189F|nr:hypothetical protein [Kitasatospora mediocidica]
MIEGFPAGPYCSGDWDEEFWQDQMGSVHCDDDHPTPRSDGLPYPNSFEFCAFDSIEALGTWFGGWLEKLEERDYRIHVYEIPKSSVQMGRVQVLADLRQAKLVRIESCISSELEIAV